MLTAEIKPYFTNRELNRLARDVGFTKRQSKLNGATFLSLILFHKDELKNQSLNGLCLNAFHEYGIDIKKQSLHERFNKSAVYFLKKVLEKTILKNMDKQNSIVSVCGFKSVRIKDSTSFQVGENAVLHYPGGGGNASSATVRIQFEFDLLTGTIVDLSLHAYNYQDAKNSIDTINTVSKDELIVRDLAYMHIQVIREINEKKAGFICRLNPLMIVYEKKSSTGKYIPLDFDKIYESMKKSGTNILDKVVYLDVKNPIKMRLILSLLPDNDVTKRIARIRSDRKRKNRTAPTKAYLGRCRFNLFLTNADSKKVPKEIVWTIYRFRWLIELTFKIWKSVYKIHSIKPVIVHRLECYIYAKLITALTNWDVIWKVIKSTIVVCKAIISIDKCSKFLSSIYFDLKPLIINNGYENKLSFIRTFCHKINILLIEKHSNKTTLMESFVNLCEV